MFEIPGFDPRTLTDEQLLDRIHDLQGKIVFAATHSTMGGGAEIMQNMLAVIEDVRLERAMSAYHQRSLNAAPPVIESDPGLKSTDTRAAAAANGPKTTKPRPTIARSSVPVATPQPVLPGREPLPKADPNSHE